MRRKILNPAFLCIAITIFTFVIVIDLWTNDSNQDNPILSRLISVFNHGSNLKTNLKIAIIIAVDGSSLAEYQRALDSVKCYAQIHGYTFLLANSKDYAHICHQNHVHFRRHCMLAHLSKQFDYSVMLDADIGVLNPKRKIEEFIDHNYDVVLYDRFYNSEIAIGSYILKNSSYAREFVNGLADSITLLPNSFHATENGILHQYIASKLFPDRPYIYEPCIQVYNHSRGFDDVFTYESCIRAVMGALENFPHIRIIQKGAAWVRDGWLSNSMWNPKKDFMFHGWKKRYVRNLTKKQLPLKPTHSNNAIWYDPFIGPFVLDKCIPGNDSWNYDQNLISTSGNIEEALQAFKIKTLKDHFRLLARVSSFLNYTK